MHCCWNVCGGPKRIPPTPVRSGPRIPCDAPAPSFEGSVVLSSILCGKVSTGCSTIRLNAMATTDSDLTIELSMAELREVTAYAVVCAERVQAIFERDRPDDRRPRIVLDEARRFVDGGRRTQALRVAALDAHRAARDAGESRAAAEAARGRPCRWCRVSASAGEGDPGWAHPHVGRLRGSCLGTGRR